MFTKCEYRKVNLFILIYVSKSFELLRFLLSINASGCIRRSSVRIVEFLFSVCHNKTIAG